MSGLRTLNYHLPARRIAQSLHKPTYQALSNQTARISNTARMAKDWSASQYLKFEAERTQPARDLLSRVPLSSPKRVVDLGCGPANSTALLVDKFPDASVSGMDSSPDMIKKAKEVLPSVPFEVADLDTYQPDGQVDLFYSNAVFQWIPGPKRIPLFQSLLGELPSGGVFAFQVPDNLTEPSHTAMREAAFAPGTAWEETLTRAAPGRDDFPTPVEIYNALQPLASEIQIWRTTYYHTLENHEAIVEWVKGTGLRPYVDPLSPEQKAGFLEDYLSRLRKLYQSQEDGKVLLPYPRLFMVAVKA
ncbi:unnamed protein product [Clonostachys byssicola]|uniref:Methyltransferase domain-containing protein n=1 Tax=Clonostachys byssicola TaxID=160290 RepID=A0A9N9UEJ6_9HYPO|nr:unnamed protein product [Clonostachys byssicola]